MKEGRKEVKSENNSGPQYGMQHPSPSPNARGATSGGPRPEIGIRGDVQALAPPPSNRKTTRRPGPKLPARPYQLVGLSRPNASLCKKNGDPEHAFRAGARTTRACAQDQRACALGSLGPTLLLAKKKWRPGTRLPRMRTRPRARALSRPSPLQEHPLQPAPSNLTGSASSTSSFTFSGFISPSTSLDSQAWLPTVK